MRILIFLLLLAVFSIPALAYQDNTPQLLFAYVTPQLNDSTVYDLHIMDALSGTIISDYASVGNDCFIPFSDNPRWIVYSYVDMDWLSYFINLDTGTMQFAGNHPGGSKVIWSNDGNWVAYQNTYNAQNNVAVFDTLTNTELYRQELPGIYAAQTDLQFVDNVLIFATVLENGQLQIYSWDGTETLSRSFENETYSSLRAIELSPDGQYLLGYSLSEIYLIAAETGAIQLLGAGSSNFYGYGSFKSSVQWLDDSAASFVYIAADTSLSPQIIEATALHTNPFTSTINFRLSPDNVYLAFLIENENASHSLWLMNRSTGEAQAISLPDTNVVDIQWLSASQLVYTAQLLGDGNLNDIYFYDAELGENRSLTQTPSINETFECFFG